MKGVKMKGVRMIGKWTSSKFHLKNIRTSQTLYYTDRKTGKSKLKYEMFIFWKMHRIRIGYTWPYLHPLQNVFLMEAAYLPHVLHLSKKNNNITIESYEYV